MLQILEDISPRCTANGRTVKKYNAINQRMRERER
jgi:hypothetical protein